MFSYHSFCFPYLMLYFGIGTFLIELDIFSKSQLLAFRKDIGMLWYSVVSSNQGLFEDTFGYVREDRWCISLQKYRHLLVCIYKINVTTLLIYCWEVKVLSSLFCLKYVDIRLGN